VNEKSSISKLISIEEAGNYGLQFIHASFDPSAHDDDSNRMHFQAPIASENDVSTLFASFYGTPKKPAAVDCGVPLPFPFSVDEPPNPIPINKLKHSTN
jgi:hypothetical protein